MGGFVHLHLHSEYSLLDGACRISDIPKAAKACGHTAVAITDHGVMYGVIDFYKACKSEGIKPIIGCEVYVAPSSRFEKSRVDGVTGYHLVLLVKNEIGYKNLICLVTKAFTEGFYSRPRIDLELLSSHSEGLIALSGCIAGRIPRLLLAEDYEGAKAHALKMNSIFGKGNFYLEVQDHKINEEKAVREGLLKLHKDTGIPLVATGDVHYIKKSDAEAQAVLMCIQTGSVITDGRPLGFENDEYYYKSTEEMEALFKNFEGAVENTQKIADECSFEPELSGRYLPTYTPPENQTPEDYLKRLTYKGLDERVEAGQITFDNDHPRSEYVERIEYELDVINSMGFSEYYLVVRDFVGYAKSQGIPVGPGRGSGAGSLVAYLNRITDVDSIKYGLLFERFLNPERVSMPDFDIDFCYNRRDEVIEYVKRRYGEERVSQIIAFATLAARAAVRDVGRALGMSYSAVDEVASLIPRDLGVTVSGLLDGTVKLKNQNLTNEAVRKFREIYNSGYEAKRLIDISIALEGMPRHTQVHAAGVVITDKPVFDYVPLAVSHESTVTQYDMDKIYDIGLVKFDFLALRYLTIISDAERLIRKREPDFNIEKISLDDEKTYKFISEGNTEGLFQLESAGMRRLLTNLCPQNIEDITAAISLYRPGPMDSIPEYLKNRKNPENIRYSIPSLKPILDVTCGCVIYQEQVMSIFREVAGYSLGKADIVRRMMAKKKSAEMERERAVFIAGAKERGTSENDANSLFDRLVAFASYAFNKSHAAAYSILAYRTAYLKCRYTGEYMAALLTSVLGNVAKTAEYIEQSSKYGVKILPPDINESFSDFTVTNDGVRFGLAAVKNVGFSFINSIVEERNEGKFASFEDFISRMSRHDLNKRQIESLIKCGAFDSLGVYRSKLLAAYENIIEDNIARRRVNSDGQLDIFSALSDYGEAPEAYKYPDIKELDIRDLLRFEKECTGLYFSGHILDDYTEHTKRLGALSSATLMPEYYEEDEQYTQTPAEYKNGSEITLSGIITEKTVKSTRRGEKMMFLTLEDATGEIELIAFPNILEEYSSLLVCDTAVSARGKLSFKDEEAPKLIISELILLVRNGSTSFPEFTKRKAAQQSYAENSYTPDKSPPKIKRLYLKIDREGSESHKKAVALCSIFTGNTPVIFYNSENGKYMGEQRLTVYPSEYVLNELKSFLGDSSVVFK